MKKFSSLLVLVLLCGALFLTNPDKEKFFKYIDSRPASLQSFGNALVARFTERTNLVVASLYEFKPNGKKVEARWLGIGTMFFKLD